MKKYTALTIGPIYKTLSEARKTRELWAASYVFSFIMKEIIAELKKEDKVKFILPYIGDNDTDTEQGSIADMFKPVSERHEKYTNGAGLFPDRLILECELELLQGKLAQVIDKVLDTLTGFMENRKIKPVEKVKAYLKDYFQIYALQIELPHGDNVIKGIMPYLDSLELQRNFSLESRNYLTEFFNRVTSSDLVKDAFVRDETARSFKSFKTLIEIACQEFETDSAYEMVRNSRKSNVLQNDFNRDGQAGDKDSEDDETLVRALTKKYKKDKKNKSQEQVFKVAHKYIAIVQADGDNVGKNIMTLDEQHLAAFSKAISHFAIDAVDEIVKYGGMPIYAGGDDLLFFAPVINGQDNIFRLLKSLDKDFQNKLKSYNKIDNITISLSFGASISYYKFPLYEALQEAIRLLFYVAKKVPDKNTLSLKILKHSGQSFGGNFKLNIPSFELLEKLLNAGEMANQLNSVMYKIRQNKTIFHLIGKDKDKVNNFINESFNESVHNKEGNKAFLEIVKSLIPACYNEQEKEEDALANIYGILRTASFLSSTNI